MEVSSFLVPGVEYDAINVGQGGWAVERQRLLRTILGSCVAVCLFDPRTGVGGMNHFVYPPRGGSSPRAASLTTYAGDICMDGLLDAVLGAGARRENLRAKAFGGGAMFQYGEDRIEVGKRNANYARDWLAELGIPLDLGDFHGAYARTLLFHPASGQHFCRRLAANFPLPASRSADGDGAGFGGGGEDISR